jgi:ADP-heptose:LPS heptosyltransferase
MLTHATLYVGNDSGISHLAAVVGARSVVLFGADQLIWRPWAHDVEPLVVSRATADDADIARVMAAITTALG